MTKYSTSEHCLEKIEDRVWKVVHLIFDDLIALQAAGIKFTWERKDDAVYVHFASDTEEAKLL